MDGVEIVRKRKPEYFNVSAEDAQCAEVRGQLAMLQEADVFKITNIAEVVTLLVAAEFEYAVTVEAFEPLTATFNWNSHLCSAGVHTLPGLDDRCGRHLIQARCNLDVIRLAKTARNPTQSQVDNAGESHDLSVAPEG